MAFLSLLTLFLLPLSFHKLIVLILFCLSFLARQFLVDLISPLQQISNLVCLTTILVLDMVGLQHIMTVWMVLTVGQVVHLLPLIVHETVILTHVTLVFGVQPLGNAVEHLRLNLVQHVLSIGFAKVIHVVALTLG